MKVLVTGGLGVIGSAAVRELVLAGHNVTTLDTSKDLVLVSDIASDFARMIGDVTDLEGLTKHFVGLDCVVHMAAVIPPDEDPYRDFQVGAFGTITVLEAARRGGVRRVVYSSSRGVYGPFTGRHGPPRYEPMHEDSPRHQLPAYPVYSTSKIFSEDAGCIYAERFGIEFFALRFASFWGPGKTMRHGGPTDLYGSIIDRALRGEGTSLPGGTDHKDDAIYVRDVARGIVAACEAASSSAWAFNISSGRLLALADFAEAVRKEVREVPIVFGPGADPFGSGFGGEGLLDHTRAAMLLDYRATYDLADAIRDYVETVQRIGREA